MKHGRMIKPPPLTPCRECAVRRLALFRNVPLDRLEWTQEYRTAQYRLAAKQSLYRQGERLDELYTVYSGWVKLYKILDNGKKQVLRFALPGDFLGFQGYLDRPIGHSAVTLTACTLCTFPRDRLMALFRQDPQLATDLMMIQVRDMSFCQEHLVSTGSRNARERIAFLLLELYHRLRLIGQFQGDASDAGGLEVPITQEDIAEACGLTPIHVNRTLRQLRDEQLISCANGHLRVMNQAALTEMANFDPGLLDCGTLV